jgi:putative sigma-54 modulation protein
MQVHITGRQVAITPALRKFAEEKLKKVEKILGGPIEAHVVLAVEKRRHHAEIQVKSRNALLSGAEETGDLYASIGDVVEKLERQALKHKEKLTGRKKRGGREATAFTSTASTALPVRAGRRSSRRTDTD